MAKKYSNKRKVNKIPTYGRNKGYDPSEWNLPEKKKKVKVVKIAKVKRETGVKKLTKKQKKAIKENNRITRKAAYANHIHSAKWKRFKESVLKQRGAFCEDCGVATNNLHLHHLNYERFGDEALSDVQLLCIPCHNKPEKHPWKNNTNKRF